MRNTRENIIRSKGYRLTPARQAILDFFNAAPDRHFTAEDVYEAVKQSLPTINLSTVYRCLDFLTKIEAISITDMGVGSPVYQSLSAELHHHLVCSRCHRVYDLSHAEVMEFFKNIQRDHGFQIQTNHLTLFGICIEFQ